MKDFYVYISSAVTKQHTQNVFTDFRVTLPHQLELNEGEWSVGVCEVTLKDTETPFDNFYICTDLIQSNFDSTKSLPILRLVEGKSKQAFANIYYSPVTHKLLDTFQIYLKPVGETLSSVDDSVFFCTLHFKRHG
jgi:hypothetical protein